MKPIEFQGLALTEVAYIVVTELLGVKLPGHWPQLFTPNISRNTGKNKFACEVT
jgi:hypothetical protein